VLFQKLDDLSDGDGSPGVPFNREREVEEVLTELKSLQSKPMPLTEAVYLHAVGEARTS